MLYLSWKVSVTHRRPTSLKGGSVYKCYAQPSIQVWAESHQLQTDKETLSSKWYDNNAYIFRQTLVESIHSLALGCLYVRSVIATFSDLHEWPRVSFATVHRLTFSDDSVSSSAKNTTLPQQHSSRPCSHNPRRSWNSAHKQSAPLVLLPLAMTRVTHATRRSQPLFERLWQD